MQVPAQLTSIAIVRSLCTIIYYNFKLSCQKNVFLEFLKTIFEFKNLLNIYYKNNILRVQF